jgi:hypothetical protein
MKKLFVFAVAFIAFTGFTFSVNNDGVKYGAAASVSTATTHEFSYFRLHPQTKKNVVLSWGITSPAGVSNFKVERSYDGDFYDVISEPACNNSTRFSWKDEGVYPGVIYYRIGCVMSDGSCHYSDIETIRVVQR